MHESQVRHVSEQLLTLIRSGTIEDLKEMLKAGNWGPNDVDDKGHTLFFYAMHHNRLDFADLLLEAGANVDCRSPHEWTPLFWAPHNQHEQAVRYLLSHGANPNVRTVDDEWPLFWGVYRDNWEIVSLLLLGGADITWTDRDGYDVFRLAKMLGRDRMLSQLEGFHRLG